MESDSATPQTLVPVKVPEPENDAPPSLAEPASGPVAELPAEMSGALPVEPSSEAKPTEPAAGMIQSSRKCPISII
jgi:hypothetical protein